MTLSHRLRLLVGTSLAAALAVGCSALPTQPIVESPDAGARVSALRSAGTTSIVQPGPGPLTSPHGQARVRGNLGGTVTNGTFTVIIPAGAFTGQARVSLTQPDPNVPLVQLNIQPESKNHFQVPVTLIVQMPGLDPVRLAASTMSEYDATNDAWMPVGGSSADAQTSTIKAPLAHFSTYRVDVPARATGNGLPKGGD